MRQRLCPRHHPRQKKTLPLPIADHQIAIIPAHRAQCPVVKEAFPPAEVSPLLGQHFLLHPGSKIQVLLERVSLGRGEVVQAVADQRITTQPRLFDRIVADLANTVCPVFHPGKRRIDFAQELCELGRPWGYGNRRDQPLSPVDQLVAKINVRGVQVSHRSTSHRADYRLRFR